jgi:hypothetical protein
MSEYIKKLKSDVTTFAELINDLDKKELAINKDSLLEMVEGIKEGIKNNIIVDKDGTQTSTVQPFSDYLKQKGN